MPTYVFRCKKDGPFEVIRKMSESGLPQPCPVCGLEARRVFSAVPDIWRTDGGHKTDYGKGNDGFAGDKRDLLNKQWGKYYGEKPPPPATDIGRNSSDPI